MNDSATPSGTWRIGVRGLLTADTAALLTDLHLTVVDTVTVLETGPKAPDTCASTLSGLQALGLDVIDLHWVPTPPEQPLGE